MISDEDVQLPMISGPTNLLNFSSTSSVNPVNYMYYTCPPAPAPPSPHMSLLEVFFPIKKSFPGAYWGVRLWVSVKCLETILIAAKAI